MSQGLFHTVKRYQTLRTHRIRTLPIVVLMPHSACNCRCVMCDIWKGNKNSKQLEERDIRNLLGSLKRLDTKRVLMSGGEALLNKNFFSFCRILRSEGMRITLLSTGMTLERHAPEVVELVDEVIVSLDGDREVHNQIRNVPGAFDALADGVSALKKLNPNYPVSARCVIHRFNYRTWANIVRAAQDLGLDRISFLAADVSSEAFNRPDAWTKERQDSVLVPKEELAQLRTTLESLITNCSKEIDSRFIAEHAEKLRNIYRHYAAHHGLNPFPAKKCNAPWVSAVVEADGTVRPCFFHDAIGNAKDAELIELLNSPSSIRYRASLDVNSNETCKKCVCSLYLGPRNAHY